MRKEVTQDLNILSGPLSRVLKSLVDKHLLKRKDLGFVYAIPYEIIQNVGNKNGNGHTDNSIHHD